MRRILVGTCAAALLAAAVFAWLPQAGEQVSAPLQVSVPVAGAAASPAAARPPASEVAPRIPIRVCLTAQPVDRLKIAIDGDWTIHPVDSPRVLAKGRRLPASVIEPASGGLRFGGRSLPASRVEIVSGPAPAIWVENHQYRGRVQIFRRPGGRLLAVNTVALEDYVASVVDSEMPATFPPAAREAQAIVARTFALYQRERAAPDALFDVYASTRSQRYLGFQYRDASGRRLAGETAGGRQVAERTSGLVAAWQGRLICTYYSAACGGRTTLGTTVFSDAAPPLQSVPCEWCRESPRYRWEQALSVDSVLSSLNQTPLQPGRGRGPRLIAPGHSSSELWIESANGRQSFSSADLRLRLGSEVLPSPKFTVAIRGDAVEFSGRGHGHGVGLCQWGARGQALAGRTFQQILQFYYPGVQIVQIGSK